MNANLAHPTAPADYKFLGWSEAGSTTVLTSAELQVSVRDLDGKTFYAQFEKVTDNYTVAPNTPRERQINIAVNTNLGFGGHNGVIIVKKV